MWLLIKYIRQIFQNASVFICRGTPCGCPKTGRHKTGLRAFHQRPERSEPHEAYRPAANETIAPGLRKEAMLATLPEQQIPLAIQGGNANLLKQLVQIWLWRETRGLFVSASSQATSPQPPMPSSSSSFSPEPELPSSSHASVPVDVASQQHAGSSSNTGFFSSSWPLASFFGSDSTTSTSVVPETVNPDVLTMMQAQLKNWIQVALTAERTDFAMALYQYLLCITPGDELICYIREPAQARLWQVIQTDIWTFHAFLSDRLRPDAWSEGSAKRAPAQRLMDSLATAVGLDQLGTIELRNAQRPHLTLWQLIHEFKQQHPQDYQTLFDRQGLGTLLVTTLSDTAKELEQCYEISAKGQYAPALALMTRLQALTPAQPQEAIADTSQSQQPFSSLSAS